MNYQECIDYLFSQLPMYQNQGKVAFKKDLTRTKLLCEILDNPEKQFKSIHIAGTNGKGSVAHMLSSVFQTAGYKTALYTSPHLKDFRERIRVDGKMIDQTEVVHFIEKYKSHFDQILPSFFEWTVALAFNYFAQQNVDIAIIETGLGGRLDSTNVIHPELSIITNIGLDHTDMLGNTLTEIAMEKAGIIKRNAPVLIGNPSGQASIFEKIAQKQKAPIFYVGENSKNQKFTSDLKGNYQKENIATAVEAINILQQKHWKISKADTTKGLLNVVGNTGLKGRWQRIKNRPTVVADTAHNKEGLFYIWKQLREQEYHQLHLVLGFVKEKNINELLDGFPRSAKYYFCEANIPRAMEISKIAAVANKMKLNFTGHNSVDDAYNAALKNAAENDFIYVGGSNFIVAEVV